MRNRVFISWSGKKSQCIADLFQKWLQDVFQIETWSSIKDIEKGDLWEVDILNALKQISVGLFFITKENWDTPWINFEAGAISKGTINKKVCVINIDSNEIPAHSPLSHFQASHFNKQDIYDLTKQICEGITNKSNFNSEKFDKDFQKNWSRLEKPYKKILYSDNPLLDDKYIPKFRLLIPDSEKENLKKADKKLLNQFFVQEYNKIESNSIGKRLQFIIDRAVIFVYLYDNSCWYQILADLEYDNNIQNDPVNYRSYNIAIQILRQVFSYHKMMHNLTGIYSVNSEPEHICNELFKLLEALKKEPKLIQNKMLYCLLYDYMGLCYHKQAFSKIAVMFGKTTFNILNKQERRMLKESVDESNEIIINIRKAISCFDQVLKLTDYNNTFGFRELGEYIWDDFALYNKARGEFLLYCFGLEKDQWRDTMRCAVNARKTSVERYSSMPFAIYANLFAEYLHARLEEFAYMDENPNADFDEEYNQWLKLCYGDVLSIQKKYELVKKMQKV